MEALDNLFRPLDRFSGLAHWALRIAIASVFLYHGLTKFPMLSELAAMMQLPTVVMLLVALAETGAGTLVLLGGFLPGWVTRVGALLVLPSMLGAIALVHWGQWAFTPSETHPLGGMEFQTTLVLIALYFLLKGNEAAPKSMAVA